MALVDPGERPALNPQPAVTLRAVLTGALLVLALDVLGIGVRYIYHGSQMTYSHMPMAMLIGFVGLLLIGALSARFTGFALASAEWHTVLIMGLIGATVPGFGLTGYLLGFLAAPYYFATEENAWEKHLHPYLPTDLLPSGQSHAIAWFFEGLPKGATVPWGIWVMPLFWWTTVIVAAFITFLCAAVILRKQWVQHERLMFPGVIPLIDMASNPGNGTRTLPEFMRGSLFWVGFGIAFGMIAWNVINYFLPGFPQFPIYRSRWYWLDRQYPPINGFLGLFTLFFAYFASLDVLLSIWVFDLLFILEGGALNTVGFNAISPYYARGAYHWQTTGAFVMLVASCLWVARRHLYDVLRKAWNPEAAVDDSGEWLSYRAALIGLIAGMAYLWVWLLQLGFSPILALALLVAMLFAYVGMARIMADTGLPYTNVPVGPWGLFAPFLGDRAIAPVVHVAYRLSSFITSHFKGLFLPALVQSGRIAEGISGDRRRLPAAAALAFGLSFVVGTWLTLYLGYHIGAYNFDSWEIVRAAESGFQSTVDVIKKPAVPFYKKTPSDLGFLGLGGAAMLALLYCRYRFVWWPLHPVGLAISGSYLARRTSFTIFLAWVLKFVLVKIGGPGVYNRSRPLFIGLLAGYILGVAFSTAVDIIWFPEMGHSVHRY